MKKVYKVKKKKDGKSAKEFTRWDTKQCNEQPDPKRR